jgi:hypothetical protein
MNNTFSPNVITQKDGDVPVPGAETIAWTHSELIISADNYATTVTPLSTISGTNGVLYRYATKQLWTSDYRCNATGELLGIELILNSQRLARVQDYVIQLCLNDELIGENKHNPMAANLQIYGSPTDLWGTELTAEDVNDPSFGVVVSMQSNDSRPHKDAGYIDQIALRIHYA